MSDAQPDHGVGPQSHGNPGPEGGAAPAGTGGGGIPPVPADGAEPPEVIAPEVVTGGVPDAARAVLSRVRASARSAGEPGTESVRPTRVRGGRSRPRRGVGGFSGPGPDERDPLSVGGAWSRLVADNGWKTGLDVARLGSMWPQIVGETNAEHAPVESFDVDSGQLVVRASSTAWAEQLRLMLPAVRTAIEAQVGPGVVRDIRILGPAPPRTRGRLRVRGRGPRDTYG